MLRLPVRVTWRRFDDAKQPKIGEAAYPYTGRSGYECIPSYYSDAVGPFGRNLTPSKLIRAAIRACGHVTSLVTAGGIHNFEQAEAVLASDQADVVGFARQALADPDWFVKVLNGRDKSNPIGTARRCDFLLIELGACPNQE